MTKKVTVKTLGSIENVIKGRAKINLTQSDAGLYFLGLGGALNEKMQFGEAIVINKTLYYTFVDEEQEIKTESWNKFKTPFLVTLGKEFISHGNFQVLENEKKLDLMDFYQNLAQQHQFGFILVAEVFFSRLEAAYVKKAPIYNENVLSLHEKYWSDAENFANQKAIIVGLAVNENGKKKIDPSQLNRIFYQNPNDRAKKSILAHTHCALLDQNEKTLVLNSKEDFLDNVHKCGPLGVRHLLNQSVFEKGNFLFFDIEKFL